MKTLSLTSTEVMVLDMAMKTAEAKFKELAETQQLPDTKKALLGMAATVCELNHKINVQPEDYRL